ncbi:MAG: NAD(P)-dependent oxidoreductase [Hylemonella sp.]|nr:NAD(P)-dependent oxidoreductase [Hylemonella sp.]
MNPMPAAPFPVAIVGVGNMGGAMAERLLELSWPVHVCDLRVDKVEALSARGAVAHATPAGAARAAEVLSVCVVDADQTEEVLFGRHGAAAEMSPGQVVMLCPTIDPGQTEALAQRLHQHGLRVLDAPMSGGPARARAGDMSLMLAGDAALCEDCMPLLAALSSRLFRVGERPGDGARTKLVNNLAAGINLVAAAEVMALARRMGLDAARTLDVIEQSSGQSWIGSDRMRRAIGNDYAPRAHMGLLEKDTGLALQAAAALDFQGPLGAAAHAVFAQARAGGMAEMDDAAVLLWLERPR